MVPQRFVERVPVHTTRPHSLALLNGTVSLRTYHHCPNMTLMSGEEEEPDRIHTDLPFITLHQTEGQHRWQEALCRVHNWH